MGLKKRLGRVMLPDRAGVSEKQHMWAPGMSVTNRKRPQKTGNRSGSKTRPSPQSQGWFGTGPRPPPNQSGHFPSQCLHLPHAPVTEHDSEASIIQIKETKAGLALGLPVSWTVRLVKGIWNPFFPLAQFAVTSSRVHELIPGISCMSGSSMWTASR